LCVAARRGLGRRHHKRHVAEARQAHWFKGEWSTLRIYAMLNREWREQRRG